MNLFKEMLEERKKLKSFTLFFDIETFNYNKENGEKKPSHYKNMTYAVGISWIDGNTVQTKLYPNFKKVFDQITEVYGLLKKKPSITLNAHNTNKYDNHFLRIDLLHFYDPMTVENYWLNTATTPKSNEHTLKLKELTAQQKKGIILEKRIKSSINLEMLFFIKGIQYQTEDNWIKTNSSIEMLGKKLLRIGKVTPEELKTAYNYTQYDRMEDLTDTQAREYAQEIFNGLSNSQRKYIENDVIILAKTVLHYSELFNGFDYSKKTFTSNILESYNTNDLTSFQLLNKIGTGKEKREVRYTDYRFTNQNFYDYLKAFYRGGLNFYNQFYVGKIIGDGVFSMDIHSSYPYAMHNFKIPTYLKEYKEYTKPTETPVVYSDDEFSLYQLSKETFDTVILDKIQSVIIKQILVKYYSTNEFININSYTFRLLENITGVRFESIPVLSKVTFETAYFGSRDQIETFYKIKTQGKSEKKLVFTSPYDITVTDEENTILYSPEEVLNSKVNLNGLYGIPALRPYFNLFRKTPTGDYENIENGHKNAERNIVFSIFVTSVSLWNLLDPLQYLTQQEIDENLLYTDTDSLYLKKAIQYKIPSHLFTNYGLGSWELEHNYLKQFYVLNHKKYAYVDEQGKINVRSGGIPHKSFNYDMPFTKFIQTQFSQGCEVQTLKSIYNNQETISLYPSVTKLEVGKGYRIISNDPYSDRLKEQMFTELRKKADTFTDDALYIESSIGTFSITDVFPLTHDIKKKHPLVFLEIKQEKIRTLINSTTKEV